MERRAGDMKHSNIVRLDMKENKKLETANEAA